MLDAQERMGWLEKHPECGVIASSQTGYEYLRKRLGREDVHLIPQHHVNFERITRDGHGIQVAGVVGGPGAIQCDFDELKQQLANLGIEFRWLRHFRNPPEIVEFYRGLDVQIVWRRQDRPLKNPLKIVNAMSFGIPTVGYPELAYKEVDGYYWPARTFAEMVDAINRLRDGFDQHRLINKAEHYHIDRIAPLYGDLLK